MQHEYLVMALQAPAKRHRVLKNGSNSDYGMDVKPSLKHTPSKPALGVLRDCSRDFPIRIVVRTKPSLTSYCVS